MVQEIRLVFSLQIWAVSLIEFATSSTLFFSNNSPSTTSMEQLKIHSNFSVCCVVGCGMSLLLHLLTSCFTVRLGSNNGP
jgi:hypothetical protein